MLVPLSAAPEILSARDKIFGRSASRHGLFLLLLASILEIISGPSCGVVLSVENSTLVGRWLD